MNAVVLIWLQFTGCLALVGLAGRYLSRSGDVIADKTGLSGGWVGLTLIATVTSLPVMGWHRRFVGTLLVSASPLHTVSAMSAMIMSGVVIVGIVCRSEQRLLRMVSWISLSLFTMYVLNSYALYLYET
jgi:Ca2+/Na+ antiporter